MAESGASAVAERAVGRRARGGWRVTGGGGGRGRRAGGDSCLMVPSARLLHGALGCLPPADRLPARQALGH